MTTLHERTLDLRVEAGTGGRIFLRAPDVGLFTRALARGGAIAPGQTAGVLLRLGRGATLVVPAGVRGTIVSERPERVRAPVSFDEVLYEVAPFASDDEDAVALASDEAVDGALVLRSPQAGRFWHRPSPDVEAFVAPGSVVEDGAPVGLIEVMKTFAHVPYAAAGTLPARAKIVRMIVSDGQDVAAGDPLLEVESA